MGGRTTYPDLLGQRPLRSFEFKVGCLKFELLLARCLLACLLWEFREVDQLPQGEGVHGGSSVELLISGGVEDILHRGLKGPCSGQAPWGCPPFG